MTQTEALKLAMAALEDAKALLNGKDGTTTMWFAEEITAIKEALAEHQQEPVAKVIDWGIEGPRLKGLTEDWPRVGTLLYACPSQRTWVGLTEDEISKLVYSCDYDEYEELVRATEAKLKEKNHG